jgi:putative oxidoreductase
VSTDDDRPGSTGGYSTSSSGGLFTPGGSGGATSKIPHDMTGADEAFGQYDFTQGATQIIKAPGAQDDADDDGDYDPFDDARRTHPASWHGGADVGLLVLRLSLAVLFVAHGVQHLFGWLNGPGIGGTEKMLAGFGFDHTTLLAWLNGGTEILGGVLLGLGLFTPAGAAAVIGLMACAIAVRADVNLFAAGVELEIIYAAAAFAILFAGPGRMALDRHTPWYRKAPTFGVIFLVIALGAAAGVYYGLR